MLYYRTNKDLLYPCKRGLRYMQAFLILTPLFFIVLVVMVVWWHEVLDIDPLVLHCAHGHGCLVTRGFFKGFVWAHSGIHLDVWLISWIRGCLHLFIIDSCSCYLLRWEFPLLFWLLGLNLHEHLAHLLLWMFWPLQILATCLKLVDLLMRKDLATWGNIKPKQLVVLIQFRYSLVN